MAPTSGRVLRFVVAGRTLLLFSVRYGTGQQHFRCGGVEWSLSQTLARPGAAYERSYSLFDGSSGYCRAKAVCARHTAADRTCALRLTIAAIPSVPRGDIRNGRDLFTRWTVGCLRVRSRLYFVAEPGGWQRSSAADISADGGGAPEVVAGRNAHCLQQHRPGEAVENILDFSPGRSARRVAARE